MQPRSHVQARLLSDPLFGEPLETLPTITGSAIELIESEVPILLELPVGPGARPDGRTAAKDAEPAASSARPAWLTVFLLLAACAWVAIEVAHPMYLELQHARARARASELALQEAHNRLGELQTEIAALGVRNAELEAFEVVWMGPEEERRARSAQIEEVVASVGAALASRVEARQIVVIRTEDDLLIRVDARALFGDGAEPSEEGKALLAELGAVLRSVPGDAISVAAHTDGAPLVKSLVDRYATAWDLSTAQAASIVRALEKDSALPPDRLMAAGFGGARPLASPKTQKGRRLNQRIELRASIAPR